jgi:hypothetical protein
LFGFIGPSEDAATSIGETLRSTPTIFTNLERHGTTIPATQTADRGVTIREIEVEIEVTKWN